MERRERDIRTRVTTGTAGESGRESTRVVHETRDGGGFELWGAPCRLLGNFLVDLGDAFSASGRRMRVERESREVEERDQEGTRESGGTCGELNFAVRLGGCGGAEISRARVGERSGAEERTTTEVSERSERPSP